MTTRSVDQFLRVPTSLRHDVEEIFQFTDPFCTEHLDAEYGELVRKLVSKLVRKRPSPLARGDLRIWAAAAIYAVGSVNFLFDRTQRPHLTGDDLSALTGVPKSTLANRAKRIRDILRIGQLEPELCRRELRASNPMAWMISVDGFIVDARTMPSDSGMTDDDDGDSLCDTSFNGIGYALQVEMLDEVTHAAWRDAAELKKAAAKRLRQRTG